MTISTSIHNDETQPYAISDAIAPPSSDSNVDPDDETIPILRFQHEIQLAPSWWHTAKSKAIQNNKWWKWTWIVGFGIISFIIMWAYSVHFLNQKNRDVHLIIANSEAFFNEAGGWAKLSDIDGTQTTQGVLFQDMGIGDHIMTIGFNDKNCRSMSQGFRLDRGDKVLTVPLKQWTCTTQD